MGKHWKQWQMLLFGGSKITADGDCSHEIERHLHLGRNQRYYLANKGLSSKCYGFSSSQRKLSAEELMILNCGVREDS